MQENQMYPDWYGSWNCRTGALRGGSRYPQWGIGRL